MPPGGPNDDVPSGFIRKISRDSKANAQFLRDRAAEVIANANWLDANSPDPTHAQHRNAIADSINVRASEIEASADYLDAELARRGDLDSAG